ncbi:hypothetical protein Q9189_007691 [Teloschistes chrysophthalmus]
MHFIRALFSILVTFAVTMAAPAVEQHGTKFDVNETGIYNTTDGFIDKLVRENWSLKLDITLKGGHFAKTQNGSERDVLNSMRNSFKELLDKETIWKEELKKVFVEDWLMQ